jgi:hypothetical protein
MRPYENRILTRCRLGVVLSLEPPCAARQAECIRVVFGWRAAGQGLSGGGWAVGLGMGGKGVYERGTINR